MNSRRKGCLALAADYDKLGSGNRIRQAREAMGISRREMSQYLHVTEKFCGDIELGYKGMSIESLLRVSDLLKLSTDYILFGEDQNAGTKSYKRIMGMISRCPQDKLCYLEDILKSFIVSHDK